MDTPDDKTRKTVSFTHKQLGVGGGILASLALVSQLKGTFFLREEGLAQGHQITELKASEEKQFAELKLFISQMSEDNMHRLERLNDKVIERLKDNETRASRSEERLDRRIDLLEANSKTGNNSKKNN